jgi:hypothetical protein
VKPGAFEDIAPESCDEALEGTGTYSGTRCDFELHMVK